MGNFFVRRPIVAIVIAIITVIVLRGGLAILTQGAGPALYRRGSGRTQEMPTFDVPVVDTMGDAYPDIVANQGFITDVVRREEERFRKTLATGSDILDRALADVGDGAPLPGSVAFQLHDTYGFPVELTEEILRERGVELDRAGFDEAMTDQQERARAAASKNVGGGSEAYRELL